MELEKHSSGVAKAGLTTGIIGTSLGALNALGNGAGLLGGLGRMASGETGGCCSDDHLVNRYDLGQAQRIAELETQIALRDANTFTDQKDIEMYKYVTGQVQDIRAQLARQAVENQKTSDSFQIVNERMGCLKDDLTSRIQNECRERRCADNSIITYTNATFYPKQVAEVRTGDGTTPQTVYNPLPVQGGCGCNCGC